MTEKRFTVDSDGKYWDSINHRYVTIDYLMDLANHLTMENEQLKQQLNEAVNQIHLVHMQSMFSTVKSFKGDVSKRYKYSEETDNIYDTANHYGQYDMILDKKEVTMLLNEYETLLNGDVE